MDWPLIDLPVLLGRSSVCDVQLDHEQVSRRHAEITGDDLGRLWLNDLGSRNGIQVKGQPVRNALELRPGVTFELGPFHLHILGSPDTEASGGAEAEFKSKTVPAINDSASSTLIEIEPSRAAFPPAVLMHLHELDDKLVRMEDIGERYQYICEFIVRENPGAIYCAVLEAEHGSDGDRVCVHRFSSHRGCDQPPYISKTLVEQVTVGRQPMMLSNTGGSDTGAMLSLAPEVGEITAIACPLYEGRGPLLYATFDRHAVTDRWLDLMVLVTDQFRHAQAIVRIVDHAKQQAVFDRDLDRARDIQLGLLPKRWEHPRLDIAIGFEPCKSVGGDYADILTMPDGRVIAAIADVAGKGLPAALISSSIHTMTHAVLDAGGTPAQAMTQLNQYLIDFAPIGAFATMLMLAIHPDTGQTQIINAGHLPLARYTPDGPPQLIAKGQYLPLGIEPQDYEPEHFTLQTGESWLLYSDGLSEMTGPNGKMLGNDGVCQLGLSLLQPTAAQTVVKVLDWLTDHIVGPEQSDDQTLLVVRRKP
ncbi:MAG: SpoIIE family protein phosphatase [Planctomycetota bacterium]